MAIKNINTDLTVNGEAQIGATSYQGDMNGGKADFSVDCGGTPEISFIGNYLQAGSTDQNWAMRLYTGVLHTYNQDLYITAGGTGTTNKLRLGTNGQTSTIVCDDGGVGIGTASPSYKLDVNGTLGSTQLHIQGGYALGSSANFLYIDPNTQFSSGIYINNAVKVDGGLLGSYNEDLQLRTGNDTRLTLSSSTGHVGIGTISPSTRLHISVPSSNSQLTLERTGSATGKYQIYTNTNNLYINNVASNTFPLTILNSGNVGIGTTSPASQLHLYGASGATGEIRLESSNGKAFTIGSTGTSYGSANNLIIYDINASTERLRIDTNGKVGIGVTNPSRELVVAGNVGLSGSNTYIFGGDNEILAGQDGSGYYFATGNGQNLTKPVFIGDNNSYIRFQSGDAERMRITSSGEVGIGTSNPETNLHIWNSESGQTATNVAGLFIENGGNSNSYYVFQTATGVGKSFSITNAGNVGIGTTSPVGKLQIGGTSGNLLTVGTLTNSWNGEVAIGVTNGNGVIISKVNTANDTNRVLVFYRDDTNGASIFGYTPSGGSTDIGFQIRANASSYFNGGNVGIGTTSPSTKLHVLQSGTAVSSDGVSSLVVQKSAAAATAAAINIVSGDSAEASLRFGDTTDQSMGALRYLNDVDAFSIVTNNAEQIRITSSGDVGIGDTTPSYKLDVNGTLRTTGQAYFNSNVTITGSATMAGGTMTGNLEINTDRAVYNASYFGTSTASTRSKIRFYGTDATYAIGMQNNCTYGGLGNTWAMTFQFSNANNRGFWWGDSSHSQAQGAMALTTDGNLTVASRIRVGYGESDTTTPATYALDATGEVAVTSGDVELTTASKGIILKSPNGTRYRVNINDSGELTTSAV
jgi:hypothetical protein